MIDGHRQRRAPAAPLARRAPAALAAALLACALAAPAGVSGSALPRGAASPGGPGGRAPASASATDAATARAMADDILAWVNRDRVAAGLRALRAWPALQAVADARSEAMATDGALSHTAGGADPGAAITSAGLPWYAYGEAIGQTSYAWGSRAASSLYTMWMASPPHRAILLSARYNYIGVGIARDADGRTWSSLLLTESADHTRPGAYNGALTRSGTTIRFAWSGSDPLLQTHTAGLRGFNIQYRMDYGPWHQIRTGITARALSLTGRPRGHSYAFRVQAVDRQGNLSAWTAERRIRVP